ncbi:UNVERIFIED_CONTAM: hypothetical protein PYX00_010705 [Menopon gallinae]|uniref:DAGKc domain-containing protein n=1 Tax=Menopon gallinae TaxID=328185 RepID=A0AAW2HGS9_9NEOP
MITDGESNSVLFSSFSISNKRCRVYFRRNVLIWEMEHLPYQRQTVPVADIIAVSCGTGDPDDQAKSRALGLGEVNSAFQGGPESSNFSSKCLVIHYAKQVKNNKWAISKVTLHHGDPRQVNSWFITLENEIRKQNRPKSFLVFVNPFCGKRKGNNVYKRSVKPILDIAKADTNVIVTDYRDHAKEVVLSTDLTKYDAVLVVGGDGTLSEVINALVLRTIRDANGDENEWNGKIPTVRLPVAIVPGGSTDCIAYSLHGTRDRKTAAIYAVLGTAKGFDVCSVHSEKGLCRYFISIFAYGFLGDVLRESEKHRWMGPKRYEYSALLKLFKIRRYYCEIDMTLTTKVTATESKCYRYCSVCEEQGISTTSRTRYQEENLQTIKSDLKLYKVASEEPKKLTVRGKYFLVGCANISCACKQSPNGIAPYGHIGDGCIDVLLFRPETLADVIRMLIRSGKKKGDELVVDYPFVDSYKATEISFKVLDKKLEVPTSHEEYRDSSVWNSDGELVSEPNVRIKNYRQLVRMLSRRPQQPCGDAKPSCFSCQFCSKNIV